jgi:hypothetical protein
MAPFWNMVVLVTVSLGFDIYLYFAYYKALNPQFPFLTFFTAQMISSAILIAEAVIYWYIREWKLKKLFIWLHIGCLYFVLIGIPVLGTALALLILPDTDIDDQTRVVAEKARFITFWSFIIAGHIFFIAAIINGFRNKKDKDSPGEVAQVIGSS